MTNCREQLRTQISVVLCIVVISHLSHCNAQTCVTVISTDQRYEGDITQCTISDTSQYDDIPSDTVALWVIYPEDHTVELTINHTLPSLPNLRLLINDITHFNASNFQQGAFVNTDMPSLDTFIITRDLTATVTEDIAYLVLDDTFLGLAQLKNLYLESLAIYGIEVNSFRGLDNLQTLSLKQNYLTVSYLLPNTFTHMLNLTSLNFHDNYLSELDNDVFNGLTNLSRLCLSLNSFTELQAAPFEHLINLEILDLSNNDIASIEIETFRGLTNLHYLAINSNDLSDIPANVFQYLPALESLILHSNTIELVPNLFSQLSLLKHLSLSNNAITRIEGSHFNGLGHLTELFIADNNLGTIYEDTFISLPSLDALLLDSNAIETVELNAFRGLNNLSKFSIEGNVLTTLPDGVFEPFSNVDTIYLNENSWVCDCGVQWLIVWLRERYDTLMPAVQWQEITCGADDPIASETFDALIQQENHLLDLCGLYTGPPILPTVAIETTEVTTQDTTRSGNTTTKTAGKLNNQVLSDEDKIILSVCLIVVALIVVIVIVVIVHVKQRKNRVLHPPDNKRQQQQQRNELANKAQTSVPSFYPDPDSGHGSSTWEISEVEEVSEMPKMSPIPASKAQMKRHDSYLDTAAIATANGAAHSNHEQDDDFRARINSMASGNSMYSYEGEYYKDGHDQRYDPRSAGVGKQAPATPGRVRTIGVSSFERAPTNSNSSSRDTNSHIHPPGGGGDSVKYADLDHGQNSDTSNSSSQSNSAGSDDQLLPPQIHIDPIKNSPRRSPAPVRANQSAAGNKHNSALEMQPLSPASQQNTSKSPTNQLTVPAQVLHVHSPETRRRTAAKTNGTGPSSQRPLLVRNGGVERQLTDSSIVTVSHGVTDVSL